MIQVFRPKYEVEECIKLLREVLESGWTGQGPKCQEFEKNWCNFTGAENAHYLNSATAGLHIAVKLLNLKQNSRIATTPITFCSTNSAILYENHIPVFCDVNELDISLNYESVINSNPDAIIWVHYAGNVSDDFYKTMDYANNHGIPVIEDCAHASGAFYKDGSRVGSRKDTISVFSFQAVKPLPTADSGMICTANEEYNKNARILSWMGINKSTFSRTEKEGVELYKWKYNVEQLGYKYNGNDIMASIALVQLKVLDRDNAYRKQIYKWYSKNFENTKIKVVKHNSGSSVHLVEVLVPNREEVIGEMKLRGFACRVHYLPNYEYPIFSQHYEKGQCPIVEKIQSQLLTLPTHLLLTKNDVDEISKIVLS